ncbi:Mrp/NBP35 family ATP-binding protein [Candidatus Kapabacteria bacterium]|nr:Mrp/NBP35 family ATP-binding protein [Candidatus Kapabacteria bacterium]
MSKLTKEQIINAIKDVKDPDLNISLGELNAIDKIEIEETCKIYLKLIQPIYWVAEDINVVLIDKLRELSDSTEFEIIISEQEQDFKSRKVLPGVKNIIAVASGKGGVGKSNIAANLAASLSKKGARVGILDADIYGPSQPTMFGLTNAQMGAVKTEDGKTLASPIKKYNIQVASMGMLMKKDDAAVVRGPMLAGYFSMLFEQVFWGNLDFLIFDLPPGTGDIQLTLTQKIPVSGSVVVTTPQEIAVADVRRAISMFNKVNVDVFGIVENMSYFTPPDAPDKKYYIFGEGGGEEVAGEFGVDLLGKVPLDIEMRDANDGGMPIVLKRPDSNATQIINEITKSISIKARKKSFELKENPGVKINL